MLARAYHAFFELQFYLSDASSTFWNSDCIHYQSMTEHTQLVSLLLLSTMRYISIQVSTKSNLFDFIAVIR